MLRVLTSNLYNGGADPSGYARLLERVDPDVVAAQELSSDLAEVIGSRFDHGLLAPADDFKGMGLASRHPIEVARCPSPTATPSSVPTGSRSGVSTSPTRSTALLPSGRGASRSAG